MHGLPLIALLLGALAVTAIAHRLSLSPPLVLVVVGMLLSFLPGVPDYQFDPALVLELILPPLLYSASLSSSYRGLRANLRSIGLLAVGLVLFTAVVIAVVAWMLLPGLPAASALVLGALVAPPDAVAAVAIGRRLGLPRRMMTVLAGESLVNDATALTLYKVGLAAAAGAVSLWRGLGIFVLASAGGVLVGLVIGWLVHRARRWLGSAVMESALGLLVPFGTYLLAEDAGVSGVLAVVVAGLYLGQRAPESGFATRLQDQAVWKALDKILESLVFALIGLQLPAVLRAVRGDLGHLLVVALVVLLATVVARAVWVFPSTYLPRVLIPKIRARDPAMNWRVPTVISWAGMRGVVTIAGAFGVPLATRGREEILLLAFAVTIGTLLLHGLTLPWLIRVLGVHGQESYGDLLAEAAAQQAAAAAALARLEALEAEAEGADGPDGPDGAARHPLPDQVSQRLRQWAEHRTLGAWERLGRQETEEGEPPTATFRRLRREMLAAERDTFVRYRDIGQIDDEVLRRVLRDLDLEEAALARE